MLAQRARASHDCPALSFLWRRGKIRHVKHPYCTKQGQLPSYPPSRSCTRPVPRSVSSRLCSSEWCAATSHRPPPDAVASSALLPPPPHALAARQHSTERSRHQRQLQVPYPVLLRALAGPVACCGRRRRLMNCRLQPAHAAPMSPAAPQPLRRWLQTCRRPNSGLAPPPPRPLPVSCGAPPTLPTSFASSVKLLPLYVVHTAIRRVVRIRPAFAAAPLWVLCLGAAAVAYGARGAGCGGAAGHTAQPHAAQHGLHPRQPRPLHSLEALVRHLQEHRRPLHGSAAPPSCGCLAAAELSQTSLPAPVAAAPAEADLAAALGPPPAQLAAGELAPRAASVVMLAP